MKKLLSFLLVLSLLLGLAGCQAAGDFWQMQTEPSTQAQTDGTTEPLFWPPLPSETEETTQPQQETTQPETQPDATTPVDTKPAGSSTDATYVPRDDEDIEPTRGEENDRPGYSEPTTAPTTEPTEPEPTEPPTTKPTEPVGTLDPNGTYDSKEDVALFIVTYGRLPNNYYTKTQAKRLFGWTGGSLDEYESGACIGGDKFYNNEGQLPSGHSYYECDIDTIGRSSRGAKRLVFTYDGLVYYTYNHYETFILLYGEP